MGSAPAPALELALELALVLGLPAWPVMVNWTPVANLSRGRQGGREASHQPGLLAPGAGGPGPWAAPTLPGMQPALLNAGRPLERKVACEAVCRWQCTGKSGFTRPRLPPDPHFWALLAGDEMPLVFMTLVATTASPLSGGRSA